MLHRRRVASRCPSTPLPTAPRTMVSSELFVWLSSSVQLATPLATETSRQAAAQQGLRLLACRAWRAGPRPSTSFTPVGSRGALILTVEGGNEASRDEQVCYGPHRQEPAA